ncbi:MAG TPA: geranylgeranyl reductase family protein [Acidobacteriaceae bacterium]
MLWDAIIVGAGPAGCAAAYDLAAQGRAVLLVDKASFPRAKACAGGLTMKAVAALRYSIGPVVRRTVREIVLEHGGEALSVGRWSPVCVMTVRAELDAYCLEQTRARGATFRQVGELRAVREEADRVLLWFAGEVEPLSARVLLGADGVNSRVRALCGPSPWFRRSFALEANVPYSATGREFPLVFDFAPVPGGYGWLFPRNDHVNVGLYTSSDGWAAGANSRTAKAAGQAGRIDRRALTEYIAERCGTRNHEPAIGQYLGMGAARYVPAGTRVLLAGDAAGFVDPLTGEGIHGAIVSGQAAASAILVALGRGLDPGRLFTGKLRRLCADLAVAEGAAARFYAQPEHGLRLMRNPLIRRAVLHTYSQGSSLSLLARGVRTVRALGGAGRRSAI